MAGTGDFAATTMSEWLRGARAPRPRHRWMRFPGRALWLTLLLALPAGGSFSQQTPGMGSAQFPGAPRGMQQDPGQTSPFNDDQYNQIEAEKRLRAINVERQKSMVADTDKLFKLATELNDEIAKSNSGELTQAQLRKVAEIEKLAHNVREKMIMSVRGPQFEMENPASPTPPPYFPNSH